MMELSEQEKNIVDMLREARPYEQILIVKDQLGRSDHYIITRTQKVIISKEKIEALRLV